MSVYLDHNATTPLDPQVQRAMDRARDAVRGNPSSVHAPGRRARALLSEARARTAQSLGAAPSEIVFTASGSEANSLALQGAALLDPGRPFRLVIAAFEHDSVRNAARHLATRFDHVQLTEVPPAPSGVIDPAEIDHACAGGASLVAVMAVNNETGLRQPIQEIARVARRRGALYHCDAVQAAGRLPLDVRAIGCDLLSISAHKIYGPPGAGLLFVRSGVRLDPLIHGGHQERGLRAGTENVAAAAGLAEALSLASQRLADDDARLRLLEAAFLDELRRRDAPFALNGDADARVPGVLNLSMPGIESHDLVVGMDLEGFAISAGAACSSGVIEPSHVLQSMGLEPWRVRGGVRISFGRSNDPADAARAAAALAGLALRLRAESSAPSENLP